MEKNGRDFNHLAFGLTFEKVAGGFQYHHSGARCSAYGFGFVRLSVQSNRHTFVQSRAKNLFEKSVVMLFLVIWRHFLCLCKRLLYTCGISIALVIHSLDPRWGLGTQGLDVSTHLQDLYGSSIAFVIHSLNHSLSARLIPSGAFRGWCAVHTLQTEIELYGFVSEPDGTSTITESAANSKAEEEIDEIDLFLK